MGEKRDYGVIEYKDKLVMRREDDPSISPLIDKAIEKGWKTINVDGNLELRRAVWLEASMKNLSVTGYSPTPADKALLQQLAKQKTKGDEDLTLRADEITRDYIRRVIPKLSREHEEFRRRRANAGISTTELDRTYGLNRNKGYRKDIDDQFYRVKGALVRALEAKEEFQQLGKQLVRVKQCFEDGIARFVVTEEERARLTKKQRKELNYSKNKMGSYDV